MRQINYRSSVLVLAMTRVSKVSPPCCMCIPKVPYCSNTRRTYLTCKDRMYRSTPYRDAHKNWINHISHIDYLRTLSRRISVSFRSRSSSAPPLEGGAFHDVVYMQPAACNLQLECKLLIVHVSLLSDEGVSHFHFRVPIDFPQRSGSRLRSCMNTRALRSCHV